jgi:hypothetical protein
LDHDGPGPSWLRVWNYLAGGKDAYQVDRDFAAALELQIPQISRVACARLWARRRLVEYLASHQQVDQFLVVGADLPSRLPLGDEVHTIARRISPVARTVYVTGDPVASVHVQALMCVDRSCGCVEAPADDPVAALSGASKLLDLLRPVGVVMAGALELLDDHDAQAWLNVVGTLLPAGSRLGIAHLTGTRDLAVTLAEICGTHQAPPPHLREPADLDALLGKEPHEGPRAFTGPCHAVGPAPAAGDGPGGLAVWCGTARIGGGRDDR